MVMERTPIPTRSLDQRGHKCEGCGAREDRVNAQGAIVCAYCRSTKGHVSGSDLIEVTCVDSLGPEFIARPSARSIRDLLRRGLISVNEARTQSSGPR